MKSGTCGHIFYRLTKGAPGKNLSNIFVEADVHSDASGRSFAGVVDIPGGSTRITAENLMPKC